MIGRYPRHRDRHLKRCPRRVAALVLAAVQALVQGLVLAVLLVLVLAPALMPMLLLMAKWESVSVKLKVRRRQAMHICMLPVGAPSSSATSSAFLTPPAPLVPLSPLASARSAS